MQVACTYIQTCMCTAKGYYMTWGSLIVFVIAKAEMVMSYGARDCGVYVCFPMWNSTMHGTEQLFEGIEQRDIYKGGLKSLY